MKPELCVDNLDYHLHVSNNATFKLSIVKLNSILELGNRQFHMRALAVY